MADSIADVKSLFGKALELRTPEERAAYLDQACAGDPRLRAEVESLLHLQPGAAGFFKEVGPSPDVTVEAPLTEAPGAVIGPYKLLQQIGEGGMGTVYMAEQTHPVQRKVALKVIKAGMDSRQVIARFEVERQALAVMDHVNIARVLDAGTTEAGLPYFVMELVHGVPITKYCDDNRLTPRQRLELFVPVCQAIQHAHQKGIIHRDIKPSNVMITLYDGKPVPKVIDFGVAKATEQKLTERTLFTQYGTMVGTLEYMSPEQAEMSALGIDTRSDIYSLGVLLYELLTGNTPLSHKTMKEAAYAEILRLIKEEEPPKPSTRLSDSGEALASISANRHTEPAKLTKLVRGELDWIVMKTLEKDRSRRYETANGFAADLQRYLNDETVQACPPSARYRFHKFARRNKAAIAVAGLVLFFLVLLGSGAGWAMRDRDARQQEAVRDRTAREAKVAGQVESVFAEVDRLEKEQKWPEALAAARRAETAVAGGEADAESTERVRQRLKDLELIDRLEQIRLMPLDSQQDVANRDPDRDYARAFRDYGVDVEELAVEASIERLKARPVLAIPLAVALDEWVSIRRRVFKFKGDDAGWKRLVAVAHGIDPEPLRDRLRSTPWQPALETKDELRRLAESIDVRAHHPTTLYRLAVTLRGDSAIRILREAQVVYPGDYWLNYELGSQLSDAKYRTNAKQNLDGAIRFYTVAASVRPSAAMSVYSRLGRFLRERGDLDEAIAVYRQVGFWDAIGEILRAQGKPDEAIAAYRKAIEAGAFGYWPNIGDILRDQGKPDEAIAAYRQAIEVMPEPAGPAGTCWRSIGDTLRDQKKPAEAAAAYRKAIAAYRQTIEVSPEAASFWLPFIGDILRTKEKPDEAIGVYRQAIEAGSKAADGYWRAIGDALRAQGKPDEAIAAYRQAIEAKPEAANYSYGDWRVIGDTLIAQGKSDEAIAVYRKAIAAYRRFIEAKPEPDRAAWEDARNNLVHSIGNALRAQGKPNEAIAVYRQAIEARPERADSYLNSIGDTLRDQKKPAEAADAYREATKLKPNDPGYHRSLGLALRDQNKPAEANAAFDRAIELLRKAPDLTSAGRYYNIGVVLRDKGEPDEAIDAFRKAIDIDPKYSSAIQDLVNALRARGRPDEAIDVYRKAVAADPKDFDNQQNLGAALVQQGKLDEAIAAYRTAIELAPVAAPTSNLAAGIYYNIGHALHGQKRMPEAIAAYYRVIELDPNNLAAPAYINLGTILRDWEKLDEATAAFRKAIEINHPNATASAHMHIGDVLAQQNKLDEAIAVYRKVIELKSDSPLTHNSLAWILATRPEVNLRDPKQAVALARRAVELMPDEGTFWNTLGAAHYRAGDWKAAIAALDKSIELRKGGDSVDWFFLAMADWRVGERDKAREWYDRAVEWMDKNQPTNAELRRVRAEAAELLGLPATPAVPRNEKSQEPGERQKPD